MTPDRHHVVAGVLVRGAAVLMGHRSPDRRWYPDVWDLPGGHVEPGEDEPAALARELREEVGVVPRPGAAGPPRGWRPGLPGLRLAHPAYVGVLQRAVAGGG